MTEARKSTKSASASPKFTDEEKAAMKERARELKKQGGKEDGEADVIAKIAEMPQPDRGMAERLHAIVKESAPILSARLWYGSPAYANEEGKVVCFFQNRDKFKTRYATLGFSDTAKLDDGSMWPSSYALSELTSADEKRIAELLRKAVR